MAQNGARSGSKKTKSGRFRVDFRMENGEGHGGERGLVKILFTSLPKFSQVLSHNSPTVFLLWLLVLLL
jgi:hypothetical protein